LLTKRQQEIYDLVHGEDMSLGEIAENLAISRQAVHDTIKRTDSILLEYESKLKLAEKFMEISQRVNTAREKLQDLKINGYKGDTLDDIIEEINAIDAVERR
ncbi:MAG: sigma factor-like helix-turn-helix DNA-binding protein, partial [Clostridiales bacterium]